MLQHHGNPLWFKNIYIKELPDDQRKNNRPRGTQPPCVPRLPSLCYIE